MITQTNAIDIVAHSTPEWKRELRDAVSSLDELGQFLGLSFDQLKTDTASPFPLRVPWPYVNRMEKANPDDPLLKQILPLAAENLSVPGYVKQPLQEDRFNPAPGIVHKYRGRVLLITTPVCAIHCRYCFRRHFPYEDNNPGKNQWRESLKYIQERTDISEIILSGGDPLACDDRHLAWLAGEIEAIPHVKRLRIHSRLPVVIPSRINQAFLSWFAGSRLNTSLVLHINHINEIDDHLCRAVDEVRLTGTMVLNQTVLLKGVNDDAEQLSLLSEKLFSAGVLPYYLHLLDPVAGANHFECDNETAMTIYRQMQEKLPGYLLPRLVRDVPGQQSKVLITPQIIQ